MKIFRFLYLFVLISGYIFFSDALFRSNNYVFKFNDSIYQNYDTIYIPPPIVYKPRPINTLTLTDLWDYYYINPCYLPLINDSILWEKGTRVGFSYLDLFNDSLGKEHPYSNRYLVGDFSVLDQYGNNKCNNELYPSLFSLEEFDTIPRDLLVWMDTIRYETHAYDSLIKHLNDSIGNNAIVLINFLQKVWNYKLVEINREYSIDWNQLYATGQSIVMCEACEDTLIMIGRFATSARRLTIGLRRNAEGEIEEYYLQDLPVGRFRNYYAGLNIISSRNWDSQREYGNLDMIRDHELGGGYRRIVKYRDKVELPNFLLLNPAKEYPNAMKGNGIHQVALSNVSRGMLGTANSLGCLRVSNFGAKFLRWWVPQNCKLFIAYPDTAYHYRLEYEGDINDHLPFKTEQEGNHFRKWLNDYYPRLAKILEVDKTGSHRNGYIIDAYYHLKNEYDIFLRKEADDRERISSY